MIKTLILHFSSSVHAPEMTGRKWPQKQRADPSIRPLPTRKEAYELTLDLAKPPQSHQAGRTEKHERSRGGFGHSLKADKVATRAVIVK